MRDVVIAGVGLCRFDLYDGLKGRPEKQYYELGGEVIANALDDADMEWKEIQAVFNGNVNGGSATGHMASKRIGMTGIPIVNVENACSSGQSALRLAYLMIAYGVYDVVLASGVEKVPKGLLPSEGWNIWEKLMGFNVMPAMYALETVRYMEDTGATVEDFARVTVKNRKNGVLNPYARFQQPVTIEDVLSSRMIAKPLRLLNACPLGDGGAAVILCSKDKLKSKGKVVTVAATVLASGTYGQDYGFVSVRIPPTNIIEFSAKQAYELSGCGPEDIDVVQAYDAMSSGELWDIEELGFCKRGEAVGLLRDGAFDLGGRLPVNTDGGLMARSHPAGATGLAQVIEIYRQIRGEAGARQVLGAKVGLAHAMGIGLNSSITILKR
jgi:acetyl-CoA acetyltransferase